MIYYYCYRKLYYYNYIFVVVIVIVIITNRKAEMKCFVCADRSDCAERAIERETETFIVSYGRAIYMRIGFVVGKSILKLFRGIWDIALTHP